MMTNRETNPYEPPSDSEQTPSMESRHLSEEERKGRLPCPVCGETVASVHDLDAGARRNLQSLGGTWLAMLLVAVVCAGFSMISLFAFGFQSLFRLPSGEMYWQSSFAIPWLAGHLLRGLGCGAMAFVLFRYAAAIRRTAIGRWHDAATLLARQRAFWCVFAAFVALLTLYMISMSVYMAYVQPAIDF